MPLLELKILKIHSFPQFSPTCCDIFSWNFAYDFILLYYRSSLSVVNSRQFLWELFPFWNLNYWQYTVFRSFLWHALTYCAEILLNKVSKFNGAIKIQQLGRVIIQRKIHWIVTPGRYSMGGGVKILSYTGINCIILLSIINNVLQFFWVRG